MRVAQTFKRPDNIEARIRKERIGVIGLFKVDLSGELAPCREAPGLGYLATHWSNTNHFGAALMCEPEAASTDAATGIKHPLARPDARSVSYDAVHVQQRVGMTTGCRVDVAEVN